MKVIQELKSEWDILNVSSINSIYSLIGGLILAYFATDTVRLIIHNKIVYESEVLPANKKKLFTTFPQRSITEKKASIYTLFYLSFKPPKLYVKKYNFKSSII